MKVSSFESAATSSMPVDDRQVLVVEADADQRRRAVSQLQGWGYLPVIASSGR
jgi:CheY-like chemotaxis protein